MNVELIDYTGAGRPDATWHAANMLIFTKKTRTEMNAQTLQKVRAFSTEQKVAELEYMASTIPSSWEFVSLTFLISGITRATAQQMTRTRQASYAMQSQRVVDMRGAPVTNTIKDPDARSVFDEQSEAARQCYTKLRDAGVPAEDARGILPLNTTTTLVARYNFRAFVDLIRARATSPRVQAEYAAVARAMHAAVLRVWPWSAPFFRCRRETATQLILQTIGELKLTPGDGAAWRLAKAVDLLRQE